MTHRHRRRKKRHHQHLIRYRLNRIRKALSREAFFREYR